MFRTKRVSSKRRPSCLSELNTLGRIIKLNSGQQLPPTPFAAAHIKCKNKREERHIRKTPNRIHQHNLLLLNLTEFWLDSGFLWWMSEHLSQNPKPIDLPVSRYTWPLTCASLFLDTFASCQTASLLRLGPSVDRNLSWNLYGTATI